MAKAMCLAPSGAPPAMGGGPPGAFPALAPVGRGGGPPAVAPRPAPVGRDGGVPRRGIGVPAVAPPKGGAGLPAGSATWGASGGTRWAPATGADLASTPPGPAAAVWLWSAPTPGDGDTGGLRPGGGPNGSPVLGTLNGCLHAGHSLCCPAKSSPTLSFLPQCGHEITMISPSLDHATRTD